jgi:hypothetical protein
MNTNNVNLSRVANNLTHLRMMIKLHSLMPKLQPVYRPLDWQGLRNLGQQTVQQNQQRWQTDPKFTSTQDAGSAKASAGGTASSARRISGSQRIPPGIAWRGHWPTALLYVLIQR